jgi:FkbM family methyltransferase
LKKCAKTCQILRNKRRLWAYEANKRRQSVLRGEFVLKVHLKKWVLKLIAVIHPGVTTRMIRVLEQSIGFGFDSGIENEVNQFLKELNKFKLVDPIILDVGANIGTWSKLINSALISSEIHAFEPSRQTFFALEESVSGIPNIHAYNFGCGEESTSQILYYDEVKSGMASLSKRDLRHLNINFEEFESVEIRRLDTFLSRSSIKPDDLKIDVEGHELAVLKGLGDHVYNLKVIQFEFGGTDIDSRVFFHDFWNFFEDKPFDFFRLTPKGIIPVTHYSEMDEVFSFTTYFANAS